MNASRPLAIGEWSVDPATNELRRGAERVRIEPKAMEVLVHLAGQAGEVVSRDALFAAVWPGVVVGDEALSQTIIKLRRALGDNARAPTYIETIAKRGYRLIAPVGSAQDVPAALPHKPRRTTSLLLGAGVLAVFVAVGVYFVHSIPESADADSQGIDDARASPLT